MNNMPNPFNNNNDNFLFSNNQNPDLNFLNTWAPPPFAQTKHFESRTQFSIGVPQGPMTNEQQFPQAFTTFQPPPPIFIETSQATSLCLDGRFDAITLLSDGYTYVFKDVYVYRIDSNFVMDPNYPKLTSTVFQGWNGLTYMSLPSKLDTILNIPETGVTYFFKNNLYWRSSKLFELDPGYPRLISENFKGLNYQNGFNGKLDASFVWSGNQRVYFIEGNRYWRYDYVSGKVEPGYPKRLSIWRGLPSRITDAFMWINGMTYFFNEDTYYRFNDMSFKVEEAIPVYPRFNTDYWFGCSNYNRLGKLILSNRTRNETNYKSTVNSLEIGFNSQEIEPLIDKKNGQNLSYTLIRPTTVEINTNKKLLLIDILLNNKDILSAEDDEKSLNLNDINSNRSSNEIRIDFDNKPDDKETDEDNAHSNSLIDEAKNDASPYVFKTTFLVLPILIYCLLSI